MDIKQQMDIISSIIMVTATINRPMLHKFLTSMVAIMLLHMASKTMLRHSHQDNLRIKAEVGTNLVEPVGDSHRILTRFSHVEEVTTVTTEVVEGTLVATTNIINNNNNIGMVKVGRSIIITNEGMVVVSIIVSKVVTATVEEVGVIIIMIKALDIIDIKSTMVVVCIIRVEPALGSLVYVLRVAGKANYRWITLLVSKQLF